LEAFLLVCCASCGDGEDFVAVAVVGSFPEITSLINIQATDAGEEKTDIVARHLGHNLAVSRAYYRYVYES